MTVSGERRLDSVTLSVLSSALAGIAEEMGAVLIRGAYSSNIKERRDCSAALFDAESRMVAQAEHIPVHLGAMPLSVEAAIAECAPDDHGERGVIVMTASSAAYDGQIGQAGYAASKGGVIALTRAMAVTYAPRGIRVNALCPGLIRTPMSLRAQSDPAILARMPELQPLTGALGDPLDVANAALFLASDEASFVTGANLMVDGGWTAR